MDDDRDPFVDELLEASLQRYRSEEPRAGLENRILANVRASAAQRRRGTWVWALAASAAVLIVAVVVLRFTSRPASPHTATVSPAKQAVAPKAETPKVVAVAPPASLVPHNSVRTPPAASGQPHRPEQFPTPAPLSAQEKLLLAYVSQTPQAELRMPVGPSPEAKPLEVTELRVAPIEIKELPKPSE